MRMFWTLFFLGSMLLVGTDVMQRRQNPGTRLSAPMADGDAFGMPTPTP